MDCAKTATKYQGCGNSSGGNQITNRLVVQARPLMVTSRGQTLLRWHARDHLQSCTLLGMLANTLCSGPPELHAHIFHLRHAWIPKRTLLL